MSTDVDKLRGETLKNRIKLNRISRDGKYCLHSRLAFVTQFQTLTNAIKIKNDGDTQKQGDLQLFCGKKQFKK